MKAFFKYFFAALLAFIVALFLLIVVPIIIGAGMAASGIGNNEVEIKNHSVLKLDFDRNMPEKTNNVQQTFSLSGIENPIGLHKIRYMIEDAANDSRVDAILLKGGNSMSMANTKEMIASIEKFKESGKPVYAYSDFMTQGGYYLNSVADSIFLNPNGGVDLKGFGTSLMFFKGAMEKYGVDVNIFYAGKFKSATEPFREKEMTAANKKQVKEYLDELLDIYQEDVAIARGLDKKAINEIMNSLGGRNAKLALKNKLIDGILFRDQFEAKLKKAIDVDQDKDLNIVTIDNYKPKSSSKRKGDRKNQVAVLFAEGTVNYGTKNKGEINETTYLKALKKIKEDDKIKALVLRVNSGGGSSLTSDIIWRAVEEVKAAGKPVVASFGGVAASGGYYIACGADTIVADPNSITGSIGVFTMIPATKQFFNKNFQVTFDSVKTNKHSLAMTGIYNIEGEEARLVQESVDDIYEQFLERVAAGRKMTKEQVHEVAQGRVWVGTAAKEKGLVDVLGGLDKAIEIAAEMIDVEKPRLKYYPHIKEDPFMEIMKAFPQTKTYLEGYLPEPMSLTEVELYNKMKELQTLSNTQDPQARIPFELEVY